MVELVEGETGLEGVVEAHVVDGLVDRLFDHQGGHGRYRGDAFGVFEGLLRQLGLGEDLAHHAEAVGFLDVDGVTGQHHLFGPPGPELPGVTEVLHPAHPEPGADHIGEQDVV
ncbi:MAG TPA: hypothetical protein VG205_03795, partial [Acidimicrobiales bacterium]|nr:hypothetical protein [Acidimicrobiales bacterium]